MKIILGTANIKKKYGLNSNKFNLKDLNKVKNYSKKNNFFLEVAEDYKNTKYSLHKKLKLFYKINFNGKKKNFNKIENLCKKKNLFCLMLHNTKNLQHKDFDKLYHYINLLKSKNIIRNFGISIYDLKDLKIIKKYYFDYVQIPLNVFNHTFNYQNTLYLRKKGTRFIARSVFFQGIIFNKGYEKLKKNLLNKKIKAINKILIKEKINIERFYLNFIKSNTWLWGFVVGVDNIDQLKKIKNSSLKKKFNFNYQKYKINEKKIIDPRNW